MTVARKNDFHVINMPLSAREKKLFLKRFLAGKIHKLSRK